MLFATLGMAAVQRFAVIAGNNEGDTGARPLYFAESDARKVADVLEDLGGLTDTRLLLGRNRYELLFAFGALKAPIAAARARGDQAVVYFYYSGHADDQRLQLGTTELRWADLETALVNTGADVRVALIDACQSGAMTRTKGGTRAPSFVFEVNERLDSAGSVFLTSSTEDEASQESNEIGGSYFTHFLVSALAGAADEDADGRVTLGEAYRHAYHETVIRTAGTRGGTQHPSFDWQLSGSGDLVVTTLHTEVGRLIFPASLSGNYAVFDEGRRLFVAEIQAGNEERSLALRPGRYLVQQRFPTWLAVAQVTVTAQGRHILSSAAFEALEYEDDVAKGSIESTIERAEAPDLRMGIGVGARQFSDDAVAAAYFPASGMVELGANWRWRRGTFVALDVGLGAGVGELDITGVAYPVYSVVSSANLGLAAGLGTRPALFGASAGIRLEGISIRRTFPGDVAPEQTLSTVAPGLVLGGSFSPGHLELALDLRLHRLPYQLDGRSLGVGYSELLLHAGYRF